MKARKIGMSTRIMLHASVGAFLGYLVLHPVAMLGTGDPSGQSHWALWLESTSRAHLPMAAYFTVIGAACGLIHAIYRQAIYEKTERIRVLEGLLPICAGCKRIRNDEATERGKGPWVPMEEYVTKRIGAQFTHCMCPTCMDVWYPDLKARSQGAAPARKVEA